SATEEQKKRFDELAKTVGFDSYENAAIKGFSLPVWCKPPLVFRPVTLNVLAIFSLVFLFLKLIETLNSQSSIKTPYIFN
ncbi:hypothetical protein, partial [Mycoplasmopsis bovis]|uniref:hypothetical protein n=1 Tax=Mycoplasmopsis bovis TaxID=28903 RepID=UPI003D2749CF